MKPQPICAAPSPRARRLSVWLSLFVAVSAFAGSALLLLDTSGGLLGLSVSMLELSPMKSFLIPGLVLGVAVGGSAFVAAGAHWLRERWAPQASIFAGLFLMMWVVVEIVTVRELHWLQGTFLLLGALQVWLGGWQADRLDEPDERGQLAQAMLAHRRIALVGLSRSQRTFSRRVAREMRLRGMEVIPVNPKASSIDGQPCYPTMTAIPNPPAVAILMVPQKAAVSAVRDCVAAGTESVWFHRGTGPGSVSPDAIDLAERAGMQVVAGVCPMMYLEPVRLLHRAHRAVRAPTPAL